MTSDFDQRCDEEYHFENECIWKYCSSCDEDYQMKENAGVCIICGEDLDIGT